MKKIEKIIDKMKVVIQDGKRVKVTDIMVAETLGLSPNNLGNYKSNGHIPYEQISDFCAVKKISINWMLYDQLTSSLEDTTMRYVGVKYIPDVTGSCGGGSEFSLVDDYEIVKFPWYMLEELKIKSHIDNIHIIDIVGDSMEPALKDKDRVFVDISKTEFNTKDIFVLSTPYGIYVKKLSRCDGKYTLHSLNKLYYAEEVEYDIEIIGTVVGKF